MMYSLQLIYSNIPFCFVCHDHHATRIMWFFPRSTGQAAMHIKWGTIHETSFLLSGWSEVRKLEGRTLVLELCVSFVQICPNFSVRFSVCCVCFRKWKCITFWQYSLHYHFVAGFGLLLYLLGLFVDKINIYPENLWAIFHSLFIHDKLRWWWWWWYSYYLHHHHHLNVIIIIAIILIHNNHYHHHRNHHIQGHFAKRRVDFYSRVILCFHQEILRDTTREGYR